jgi:hypothetical protein
MICPQCKEIMKCIITGATITTYTKYATNGPYEKWQCDYFECQFCGNKLYTGFPPKPFETGDDMYSISDIELMYPTGMTR